jgi:hypothetical protein
MDVEMLGGRIKCDLSIPGIENPSQRVSVIQAEVHWRQILGQRLAFRLDDTSSGLMGHLPNKAK